MNCRSPGRRRRWDQPGAASGPTDLDADLALMERIDEYTSSIRSRAADAAGPAESGRPRDRPPSRRDADGRRGDLPPPEHVETGAGAQIYPYLLRNLAVTRSNQVWASNITYVPMARGFVYLVIVDLFSRKVPAPGGSRSRCRRTSASRPSRRRSPGSWQARDLQHRSGKPVHLDRLHQGAEESRDRDQHRQQGAWRDNVFVERLWRTVWSEEVYLRAYTGVAAARALIGRYLGLLQWQEAAFIAWREDPDRGRPLRPGDQIQAGGSLKDTST